MSAVQEAIEDVGGFVGDIFESVGDIAGDFVELAGDVVEEVGGFVGDVVQGALDDPVGTIIKVAAVASGNAWALPYISAGTVIVNGGSLEDAIIAGGTTYIVQGVTDYIRADVYAPGDFDYGPSIPDTSVTPYTTIPGDFDYGPANITVEDLYRQYAGREADPGGLAFWEAGFGDTIDAAEVASFQEAVANARAAGTEPLPVAPDVYTPPPVDSTVVNVDVAPPYTPPADVAPPYTPPVDVAPVPGLSVADTNTLLNQGYTPQDLTELYNNGFDATEIKALANQGVTDTGVQTLVDSGFTDQIQQGLESQGLTRTDQLTLANQGVTATEAQNILWQAPGTPADFIQDIQSIADATGKTFSESLQLNGLGYTAEGINSLQNAGLTVEQINQVIDNAIAPDQVIQYVDKGFTPEQVLNERLQTGNFNNLAANTPSAPVVPAPFIPEAVAPSADMSAAQARTGWRDIQTRVMPSGEVVYYSPSAYFGDGGTVSFDAAGVPQVQAFSGDPISSGAQVGTVYQPDISNITDWQPTYGPPTEVAGGTPGTITDAGPYQPGITPGDGSPVKLDVSGAAGTAESPDYANPAYRTPGTELATLAQIDAGTASWNVAANAWEINAPYTGSLDAGPGAYPYTPGISLPDTVPGGGLPVDSLPGVDLGPYAPLDVTPGPLPDWYTGGTTGAVTPVAVTPGDFDYGPVGTGPVTPVVTPYNPYTDQGPSQPGVVTPGSGGPPVDTVTDLGTIPVTDTRPVAPPIDTVTDLGTIPIIGTRPYTPTPVDNTVVNVIADTPPDVFTPTPPDNTVVPVDVTPVVTPPADVVTPPIDLTPYIPILVPPIISTPDTPPPYVPPPYVPPTFTGSGGQGLNPGLMAPTPFYQTYNPAQSKFSWGAKGYQPGTTFNAQAYNQAPASATPWGLQQLATPLTAQQIADILAGRAYAPGPVAPMATRTQAYNPASMISPNATNVYQLPVINEIKG